MPKIPETPKVLRCNTKCWWKGSRLRRPLIRRDFCSPTYQSSSWNGQNGHNDRNKKKKKQKQVTSPRRCPRIPSRISLNGPIQYVVHMDTSTAKYCTGTAFFSSDNSFAEVKTPPLRRARWSLLSAEGCQSPFTVPLNFSLSKGSFFLFKIFMPHAVALVYI